MLASDYYPDSFYKIETSEVDKKYLKKAIDFVEKSECGITISVDGKIVYKNKNGDILIADKYQVLPKNDYEKKQEEGSRLIKEIEEFLKVRGE